MSGVLAILTCGPIHVYSDLSSVRIGTWRHGTPATKATVAEPLEDTTVEQPEPKTVAGSAAHGEILRKLMAPRQHNAVMEVSMSFPSHSNGFRQIAVLRMNLKRNMILPADEFHSGPGSHWAGWQSAARHYPLAYHDKLPQSRKSAR